MNFIASKKLEDSHTAEADTRASLEVLLAQVERYENQPVTDGMGHPIGTVKNDLEELNKLTSSNMIDLAGRMVLNGRAKRSSISGSTKTKVSLLFSKKKPHTMIG